LAGLAGLSPFHFSRAFKESFGLPPHRYLNVRRIERAKALLAQPELSVTQIGVELGFAESSSFSTAFHKRTGITPTGYRRSLE
jgi:AraC family transcriptional regulator